MTTPADSDIVFLAHWVGGGLDAVLDLTVEDFHRYFEAALEFYRQERTLPQRVVLAGIERK